MRVVHLVQYFQSGYLGGIQRYVAELAHCQQKAGLDVSVYTVQLPDGNHADRGEDMWKEWALSRGAVAVSARRAWGTFLRTPVYPPFLGDAPCLAADVAHIHGPSPWFDLALLWARRRWRRTVLTIHNTFPDSTRLQRLLGRPGKAMLMQTVARSDIVIGPHWRFLEELMGASRIHTLARKLRIVPPGVDHGRFRPLGLSRDPERVLFVAHIRPEKGLHVLIEAMRRLPHLRLDVLGSVSYEHRYFEAVRSHAHRCLGDRIRFVINPDSDTLLEAYNRVACVVVPSVGLESWNLVLMEAAACGAACVRTDLPGLAWAEFARTTPAGDAAELAKGIAKAVAQREELGAKARDAATQFSWQRTHQESLAAYQAALDHA